MLRSKATHLLEALQPKATSLIYRDKRKKAVRAFVEYYDEYLQSELQVPEADARLLLAGDGDSLPGLVQCSGLLKGVLGGERQLRMASRMILALLVRMVRLADGEGAASPIWNDIFLSLGLKEFRAMRLDEHVLAGSTEERQQIYRLVRRRTCAVRIAQRSCPPRSYSLRSTPLTHSRHSASPPTPGTRYCFHK